MKKNIIFILVIVIVAVGMSSCGLAGTSMSDRIGYFEDDLNGSRTNIIDNVHSDAPGYNTANSDLYWSDVDGTWDPVSNSFSITNTSEGSSSISGTFTATTDFPSGTSISFEMKDDGDFFSGENWKIWSCSVDGNPQF